MACFQDTQVNQHQKGKPFWISLKQEMMGRQWHQFDHMQIIWYWQKLGHKWEHHVMH